MPHSQTCSTAPLAFTTSVPTPHSKSEISSMSQAYAASNFTTFACARSRSLMRFLTSATAATFAFFASANAFFAALTLLDVPLALLVTDLAVLIPSFVAVFWASANALSVLIFLASASFKIFSLRFKSFFAESKSDLAFFCSAVSTRVFVAIEVDAADADVAGDTDIESRSERLAAHAKTTRVAFDCLRMTQSP